MPTRQLYIPHASRYSQEARIQFATIGPKLHGRNRVFTHDYAQWDMAIAVVHCPTPMFVLDITTAHNNRCTGPSVPCHKPSQEDILLFLGHSSNRLCASSLKGSLLQLERLQVVTSLPAPGSAHALHVCMHAAATDPDWQEHACSSAMLATYAQSPVRSS